MKKTVRALLAAGTLAAPFAVATAVEPASATCRPEKPSTCEPVCPGGNYVTVGPWTFCVPFSDDIAIDEPQLPDRP